ncbi:MAG TPA: ribbon-helix-helix protein, CopG family [Egibacteraceae bacterium]|jgi:predicted transcriptional regulator|nr:ribbon-helix-helix protein, CopG family [Egibacteraceae bacterium]
MAARHVTLRLDADVVDRLDERSQSTGRKRPELITRYVDEGMRMEEARRAQQIWERRQDAQLVQLPIAFGLERFR